VEPSIEAQDEWVETIHKLRRAARQSWPPARLASTTTKVASAPDPSSWSPTHPGLNAFNELLAEWRAKGDLSGLIVHRDMHCADPFALSSQDRRVG